MRTLLLTICISLLFISNTDAQQKQVVHKYDLILTLDNPDLGFMNKPSMLLVTPDKKYLICGFGRKKGRFQIYEILSGKLTYDISVKGKFTLGRYFFEGEDILYLGNGRNKTISIDLTTGKTIVLNCKSSGNNVCDRLDPYLDIPSWTWEGGNLSEISYPGKYLIRYTPEKIHMYYNMDRL